ncbi:hypothetical protein ScPMuIL_008714 [Solemya velum]
MDEKKKSVVKESLKLPKCWDEKLAFVLHNVLTRQECDEYIRITEEKGYEEALLNVGGGRQILRADIRNSSRCIWDSTEEVLKLWKRMKKYIPSKWKHRKVLGLNERLRFLKYDPGEYFKPHFDGQYVRDNGEISYITVLLYLNTGYDGGNTTFLNFAENEKTEMIPQAGSALIFEHGIFHEGSLLLDGRKYVMRTDVMYSASSDQ